MPRGELNADTRGVTRVLQVNWQELLLTGLLFA